MLLHFSLFTMPTHFKSINTVSRFWLTDCHLVSHTSLDKKKEDWFTRPVPRQQDANEWDHEKVAMDQQQCLWKALQ